MSGAVPWPTVPDLHANVPELHSRLRAAADRGDMLDAFLCAAGIVQVGQDYLHGTAWLPSRVARQLGARGTGATALRGAVGGLLSIAATSPAARELRAWLTSFEDLADALADAVIAELVSASGTRSVECVARVEHLLRRHTAGVPGRIAALLEGSLLRPPSSFRSFDQHPRDVIELVARFARKYPERDRQLVVVGLRTSGSYLAPLTGAALREAGYRHVRVRTVRPGEPPLRGDREFLRSLGHSRGLVLLCDDPPTTGGSLAAVAGQLGRAGIPDEHIVMLLAAFGDGSLPDLIAGHPSVVLPGADWYIRTRMGEEAMRRTLEHVLPDHEVIELSLGRPALPSRWSRVAVPVSARVRTGSGEKRLEMVAEAAGTGYFGRYAIAIADQLGSLVPRVYGFHDGVLLRERQGEESGEGAAAGDAARVPPHAVVQYVTQRRQRLAVTADRSSFLKGRQPVWEVGARVFADRCGMLAAPLRPLLIDPLLRALLRSQSPCLVDGRISYGHWREGADGWIKVDFHEGLFSHLDLAAYDAAYDLAGAALSLSGEGDGLLTRYEKLTGSPVPPSQWCLYKVAHGWNAERLAHSGVDVGMTEAEARRAQSRAVQQYLAGLFLQDVDAVADGPWCVLDVDGVLETSLSGFPVSTPAGMLALRALRAHGYRVLLATGRSLPEVRDRCRAYGLSGGVAEYGAVAYDAASDRSVGLVAEHDGALTALLSAVPSVSVDSQYRWAVRAYRGKGARRRAMDMATVSRLMAQPGGAGRFSVVQGDMQTDFVPLGIDKATGLLGLMDLLGDRGGRPVLAVGDSFTDIPMLQSAETGCAPRNADRAVRAAGFPVLRRPCQAGLAEAVGRLLGHRPGRCPVCRAPRLAPDDRALTALLAVPESGRAGMPARLVRLALASAGLDGSLMGNRWSAGDGQRT
ncbi:hydroxymethylpyrimidine pyrophosphatase-like HAD family hydrolase [Streptomyces sp. SLBN-118]|uniref:HAD hydrolase family protein n=1 Tax=Streptomyces sp. SLBN-118 TaxID=2768454 RepID=UPI00114DEA72|nr:HAD hydrolase family protein [Streptomyces sp. SLBN-118]TQK50820.1 hydroxymethylpyrimidine pyrophosphatase-like HAD family hydrolase [Streptomyces sp. SLBN-118]